MSFSRRNILSAGAAGLAAAISTKSFANAAAAANENAISPGAIDTAMSIE